MIYEKTALKPTLGSFPLVERVRRNGVIDGAIIGMWGFSDHNMARNNTC